jgi:hypothetical protein
LKKEKGAEFNQTLAPDGFGGQFEVVLQRDAGTSPITLNDQKVP